ncbi:MAG: hypothetical protein KKD48_04635 [Nanoarchaeota archaeon]|nr:hypothetical protein [Nanoarchaeota archaeon]
MKKINLIAGISLIILFGTFIFLARSATSNVIKGDVFEGIITNMNLQSQVLDGMGVYDKNCNAIENGLTQCDGGIQTEKGLLNFNYKHNMHMQKCIDQGQKLKVEIFEGNKARVTRL